MGSGVVTVGRKRYVSGLYWENSPTGRVSQAAKEAARQPGSQADFYAIRPGDRQGRVPQFGLASKSDGVSAGIPSLAGCLAAQQPGSWIGAFRLREGTALIVVRDDLIVPDGDVFFVDEVEARDRLFQEMAIGGFQRIYAPEAWGVPNADTMPLSLLLNERSDIRLRSVEMSAQAKIGILAAFSIVILLMGAGWYFQEQARKQELAEQERMATLERLRREAERLAALPKKPEYPPPERKWEDRARPMEVITACQSALTKVTIKVAGWKTEGIRCNEGGLSINWRRTGGMSNPPPDSRISDSADSASTRIPLVGIAPRGHEDLIDPDVVTKRYLNQNWPGRIARIPDDPPPPPPPDYKGEWNPPPPPWVKRSFTVSVAVLPGSLPIFFSDLPGVMVNSMVLNGTGYGSRDTWTVEGVIYENRHN